jgi:hypothetical protein
MFYSQSMKDMSLWDAQIAYIYRQVTLVEILVTLWITSNIHMTQLITNYGHNAMNRSEESDYLANICHQEFVRFKASGYLMEILCVKC